MKEWEYWNWKIQTRAEALKKNFFMTEFITVFKIEVSFFWKSNNLELVMRLSSASYWTWNIRMKQWNLKRILLHLTIQIKWQGKSYSEFEEDVVKEKLQRSK